MSLRAVVIGAGWAGEGHAIGLRDAGVEVVALCGRTPEPARARAEQLGVPVRLDWGAALEELRPEIVTIGTPGDTHRAMAEHAAALGCHIVCEKPLATSASDARAMLEAAARAGVKHAYAATGRYAPAVIYAQELVAQGVIGAVREIELRGRWNFPTVPYNWVHSLAHGGGPLNNLFTHHLEQVLRVTGGAAAAASGVAGRFHERAPVGPAIHDFRDLFAPMPGWSPEQATEWRDADADSSYTVVVDIQMPQGRMPRATFMHSLYGQSPDEGGPLMCYGDGGTLAFNNSWGELVRELRLYSKERAAWESLIVPDAVMAALPQVEDGVQRCWNQLFREFVADVRGEGYAGYPTFREGWLATEITDAARAGRGWVELPAKEQAVAEKQQISG